MTSTNNFSTFTNLKNFVHKLFSENIIINFLKLAHIGKNLC